LLQSFPADVKSGMRTSNCIKTSGSVLVATALLSTVAYADSGYGPASKKQESNVKYVFVTGSNIPKKIKVKSIGTNAASQIRVYKRDEIDKTGRYTTEGVLRLDPSLRVVSGHGVGIN
jgi:hypothetical protein